MQEHSPSGTETSVEAVLCAWGKSWRRRESLPSEFYGTNASRRQHGATSVPVPTAHPFYILSDWTNFSYVALRGMILGRQVPSLIRNRFEKAGSAETGSMRYHR